ncbi:hypothetical protein XM38_006440 [Halomicronema hongdechloris C2206]|uniref:YkgJ family cysteine cluster protein n=1 Tax=Halomicronema hongdechloris C2206 TaxID=1641165 RepID=A0A1Z3HHF7_9CYAN|nr:YkgJ family cysteine cluster protein [Halomicronema hongdechloris]ASC69715.1 hypothetical protein XM38_006440 [Halomicronema hongdechloris C2206]
MATWQCIEGCGACCHLDPQDRPDLDCYLSPADLALYLSLVGADGWCIHFDHATRRCRIYAERPGFCRVEAETFEAMYGIDSSELNAFAIDCCRQQITAVHGAHSAEMERFNTAVDDNAANAQGYHSEK